jgi:hypothetical protein
LRAKVKKDSVLQVLIATYINTVDRNSFIFTRMSYFCSRMEENKKRNRFAVFLPWALVAILTAS